MKSIKYFLAIAFSLYCAILKVAACGPELYELPRPTLFHLDYLFDNQGRKYEDENLRLWQEETSNKIDIGDLRKVIYGDVTPDCYGPRLTDESVMAWEFSYQPATTENSFLSYLYNTNDVEALNFLMLAKQVASLRIDRNSPWYYPSSKYDVTNGFEPIIKTIEAYKGQRFHDRYSLQLIRALFASGRYEDCISVYDKRFKGTDNTNLMKRMSADYVAGAAARLGDSDMSKEYFAKTGDVESLNRFCGMDFADAFRQAANAAPNSFKLFEVVHNNLFGAWVGGYYKQDTIFSRQVILPTAYELLRQNGKADKVVWNYIASFIEGEFNGNKQKAYRLINRAFNKSDNYALNDYIHAYKVSLEADLKLNGRILGNLKWLESKVADVAKSDNKFWVEVVQSIVLAKLAPQFAKKGDVITALQLANYGENMPLCYMSSCWRFSRFYGDWRTEVNASRLTASGWNPHDYSNSFFQFMDMQRPETIERYVASLSSTATLAAYLNSRSYTSKDYLLDVAGTLYIRYRDYDNAVRVLSKISDSYQSRLNVDRNGFLRRDPFRYMSKLQKEDWHERGYSYCPGPIVKDNIHNHKKLYFAKEMRRVKNLIRRERNVNKRNLARIKFAIGLESSFNSCWALTSYSRGSCLVAERTDLTDWENMNDDWPNKSPIEEEKLILSAISDSKKIIRQAMQEIKDPEYAAQANYILFNYKTIARYYPNTKIGRMMASACDSWEDWIK